MYATL